MFFKSGAARLRNLVAVLFPEQAVVRSREIFIASAAVLSGVMLVVFISAALSRSPHHPIVVASMGASALLLFSAWHSPMSQPWAFVGGQLVSAAIGVACAQFVPGLYLPAALAVALSAFAMYHLRCLHPPAASTALVAVVDWQAMPGLGFDHVFLLVGANVAALLTLALLLNNLLPGRRYPIKWHPSPGNARESKAARARNIEHEDLIAALREMDAFIDVTEEDLNRIYSLARLHMQTRQLGGILCRDIMSRNVVTLTPGASLATVWKTLRQSGIRGAPVVDAEQRVVGMVTITDFLKHTDWEWEKGCAAKMLERLKPRRGPARQPRVAADIMTTQVAKVDQEAQVVELFVAFTAKGINHLPVVDEDKRLVGIVTRLDLLHLFFGEENARQQAA